MVHTLYADGFVATADKRAALFGKVLEHETKKTFHLAVVQRRRDIRVEKGHASPQCPREPAVARVTMSPFSCHAY
jgi:hypothetical protein